MTEKLSPRQAEAYAMYQAQKTRAEIAQAMGLSKQNVASLFCEIRKRGYAVALQKRRVVKKRGAWSRNRILDAIRAGHRTTAQIVDYTGIKKETLKYHLRILRDEGTIRWKYSLVFLANERTERPEVIDFDKIYPWDAQGRVIPGYESYAEMGQ